jgi:hypothetical protein
VAILLSLVVPEWSLLGASWPSLLCPAVTCQELLVNLARIVASVDLELGEQVPLDFLERSAFPGPSPAEPERRGVTAADVASECGQRQRAGQEKSGMDQHGVHMRPPSLDVSLYRGGDAGACTSVRSLFSGVSP